jgi:hypothetical protein
MPATHTRGQRPQTVRLDLDFGSYELGADDCRELIRVLRRHGRRRDGEAALASAQRLDGLLAQRAGVHRPSALSEAQLDAIADAAWEWLRSVGPDRLPERVLVLLDVLRARHIHE